MSSVPEAKNSRGEAQATANSAVGTGLTDGVVDIATVVKAECARLGQPRAVFLPGALTELQRLLVYAASCLREKGGLSGVLGDEFTDEQKARFVVAAAAWSGSEQSEVAAVAQSLVFSSIVMTIDEWGNRRTELVRATHVLAGARENPWLGWLVAPDAAVSPDTVCEGLREKVEALKTRLQALAAGLPVEMVPQPKTRWSFFSGEPRGECSLAPTIFPLPFGQRGGATVRELRAAEAEFGFPLTPWLRTFFLASSGTSLANLVASPLHLVVSEFHSHEHLTSFGRQAAMVPIRNAVAGGRWGECWDMALCGAEHNDAIAQIEFFFKPDSVAEAHASKHRETIAGVEAALAAGKYHQAAGKGEGFWTVDLNEHKPEGHLTTLNSAGLSKARIRQIDAALHGQDFIQVRF